MNPLQMNFSYKNQSASFLSDILSMEDQSERRLLYAVTNYHAYGTEVCRQPGQPEGEGLYLKGTERRSGSPGLGPDAGH